jgi:recyclin-1
MAFARVSHRLQEMVYDDTRWVIRLQLMGVWNETEARKRFEDAMRRKRASDAAKRAEEERKFAEARKAGAKGRGSTIFDIAEEEAEKKKKINTAAAIGSISRRVDLMSISSVPGEALRPPLTDRGSLLTVIRSVRSIRGFARQEFGRIYGALAPLYLDLVRARTHTDPIVFQMYRDPEEQAQMLAQLRTFSDSDTALGWPERTDRLKAMMGVFENAALREFEGGYESGGIDGRMRRYAHVLITLNGGGPCIQLFVQKHSVLYEKEELGNPMDCFEYVTRDSGGASVDSCSNPVNGAFSLEPAKVFWEKLAKVLQDQADVIDRVFPRTVKVLLPFLERVSEDVISEYVTPILDEAHDRNLDQYLKAVTGLLKQSMDFGASLKPGKDSSSEDFTQDVVRVLARVFDPHVDLYLQEELDHARQRFNNEVETWEKHIQEQDAATETFFMSNINREADKRDFLSTFKKVILAPVSVIPSAFTTAKLVGMKATVETSPYAADGDPNKLSVIPDEFQTRNSSRLSVASGGASGSGASGRTSPALSVKPTTELAAKAAIMNTKLEGIRSLFSLDVALKLVHLAKESLERARIFTKLGGQTGEEAYLYPPLYIPPPY